MENSKHAVLRKLFSGVEQSSSSAEASNRWGKQARAGKSSNNVGAQNNLGRGIPVTGSVRERAKAFEERHAGNSNAYVPTSTPPGSAGQRPQHRAAKTSGDGQTGMPSIPSIQSAPSHKSQAQSTAAVDVRRQQVKTVPREQQAEALREPSVLTSVTAFPPQQKTSGKRNNVYELPTASPTKSPGGNRAAGSTPLRTDKHVSSPPTQPFPINGQANKPTVRAGAFQAARSRSNSTPRASEWFSQSPRSTQAASPRTRSEIAQRSATRPQSMIVTPTESQTEGLTRRESLRVSVLPMSGSRKARASLESIGKDQLDLEARSATPPRPETLARPVITQRSVSAHPNIITRPVRDNEAPTDSESYVAPHEATFMQVPTSANSDSWKTTSMQMERAKSSPGGEVGSPAKTANVRPRSLTLSTRSPAELDTMFKEFIESLNLPETVSRRMLSVDARVKLDMLRSGTPASSISKGAGQSILGTESQARMPIPQFGEKADSAKPTKKRPTMLRKMKSFMSNKEPSTDTPEGFLMVEPISPRIGDLASSATSRISFDYTKEIDPAVSQAAAAQAHMIRTKTMKQLDPVKDVRKLRVLLRNESLAWLTEWIKFGGYRGLMERLHEVVTLEWREEQHDDQVLMELLKCFRGLLMSQPGRQCLATFSPSPFRPLVELLFSEKKPGDLASRQCIVEIIMGLFDVFLSSPPASFSPDDWRKPWSRQEGYGTSQTLMSSSPQGSQSRPSTAIGSKSPQLPDLQFDRSRGKSSGGSSTWESTGFTEDYSFVSGSTLPAGAQNVRNKNSMPAYGLVKSLVIGPPNEKEEAQVYFIKSTRKNRVYKLWMDEIIGVLSDYFWIFCHSSNSYWRLENIQEAQLEEPKVPGGMTGGVEYEAMEYCAAHLRLLNRLCKNCPAGEGAVELHNDLFMSGIDKVILTLRKCSTVYYPHIHLELARYIDTCLSSGFPLHPNIRKYIEPVSSLKESLSAGKLAQQAAQRKEQSSKKGHHRSRTDGQIMLQK